MAGITTLLWDVGGVTLTNGWDTTSRRAAVQKFGLEAEVFERRHHEIVDALETGKLSLHDYLRHVVFDAPRPFSAEDFMEFMRAQSRPNQDVLAIAEQAARSGRYLMGTLNNESLDLNLYRIERFGLRRRFTFFFSSCFLGVKKPEEPIFRLALRVLQRPAEACLFIDDRPENLEGARRCGIRGVQCVDATQLRRDLAGAGVDLGRASQ